MSLQLDRYLEERAAGSDVLVAADRAGLGETEALLTEKAIEKGDLELPRARARARTREDEPNTEDVPVEEELTISVNGGPDVPLSVAKEALDIVKMRSGNVAADELRLLVERVERLEEEIRGLNKDKSDVFQEAKSRGFDAWAMKECIKYRRLEKHQLVERVTLLELYMSALGLDPVDADILQNAA